MPGFIKTKSQEVRWQVAKKAAAKSKGKSPEDLKGDDFALVNYIYHKMGKTGEDFKKAEELKKVLIDKPSKAPSSVSAAKSSLNISSTKQSLSSMNTKTPSTKVSVPKQKTMATISDNTAKHFKPLKASEEQKSEIEEFEHMKHPTLHKLLDFIRKKHKRIR